LKHVRPYRIFALLDAPPSGRIASVKIPNRRDLWLIETFLLITALRVVRARRVFEFGTFFGSTTLNLALNSPADAEVFTFDLSRAEATNADQLAEDALLTKEHLDRPSMEFENTTVSGRIRLITGNSRTFDFSPWRNSIDFVFIDGGHDYDTVRRDTDNALAMLRKNSPACIFWHDYGHRDYSGNTYFLNQLSKKLDIFHIEDTMLCGWFSCADLGEL
jgi:SAM-dependent methyltransferase